MIKAVIFDLDETLLDKQAATADFLKVQYRKLVAAEFGKAIFEKTYSDCYFQLEKEGLVKKADLYPALTNRLQIPASMSDLLFNDFRQNYPDFARPMEAAKDVLLEFRQIKLRCAIISNGDGYVQHRKIEVVGFHHLIEFALISGSVGLRKPDRRLFDQASERLGVLPAECLFIGDDPVADIMGALNAGMEAIYLGNIQSWPEDIPKPRYVCRSLREAASVVKRLA